MQEPVVFQVRPPARVRAEHLDALGPEWALGPPEQDESLEWVALPPGADAARVMAEPLAPQAVFHLPRAWSVCSQVRALRAASLVVGAHYAAQFLGVRFASAPELPVPQAAAALGQSVSLVLAGAV